MNESNNTEKWVMPPWMEAFRTTVFSRRGKIVAGEKESYSVEKMMNADTATGEVCDEIIAVRAKVELLEQLYRERRIHLVRWFETSPDAGHPDCECSFCGIGIGEGDAPIRLFAEDDERSYARLDLRTLKRVPLKALTVIQPWLWAIIYAGKDIENRKWRTHHRGRVALHSARILPEIEYKKFVEFRRSLKNQPRILTPPFESFGERNLGFIEAVADLHDCVENSPSQWAFPGEFGFALKNVRRLPEPIPCKGKLKLWNVPEEIENLIEEQLKRSTNGGGKR